MINFLKRLLQKHKKLILQVGLYFLLVSYIYWPAFGSYFQQDEWFFMAYYNQFRGLFWPFFAFIAPFVDLPTFSFHLTPLGSFLYGAEFRIFWIHYKLYLLTSIFFHSINCFLIYKFVSKITKSFLVGIVASLFFAGSSSIMEATFWVGAHVQVQLALTFYLISIILFCESQLRQNKKYYIFATLFFVLSILTKETVSLLIVTYPLLVTFLKGKASILKLKAFYGAFVIYILFRFSYPFVFKFITHEPLVSGINNHSQDPLFVLFFSISLLLKAGSQVFFSGINFTGISESITDLAYTQYTAQKSVRGLEYLTFTQSAAHDVTLYLFAIPVFLFFAIILTRYYFANRRHFYMLLYAFTLFILGVLPLTILSSWLMTFFTYISSIESRQLYISAFGASIFVGFMALWLKEIFNNLKIYGIKIGSLVLFVVFGSWMIWQISVIHQQIQKANLYAKDRKEIVNILLAEKKELSKKTLFYSQSNVALYGFADYMLPFQNNPGQVIFSIYGSNNSVPKEFLTTQSLTKGLTEQWYEEHNGVGVGYYLKKKDLIQAINTKNINLDDVVSIKYDGEKHEVLNMSQDIRAEMKTMYDVKNEISTWKKYTNNDYRFEFYYPPKYILDIQENNGSKLEIKIINPATLKLFTQINIYQKAESEGVSDKAKIITGVDEYTVTSYKVGYTTDYTAIQILEGDFTTNFFSTITNSEVKSIKKYKDDFLDHAERVEFDKFIKFIEFYN